jgi:hypothetical protein
MVCSSTFPRHGPKWFGTCLLSIRHATAHAIGQFRAPEPLTLDYITNGNFPQHPPGYTAHVSLHLLDSCRLAGVQDSLTDLVEQVLILIADLNVWFSDPGSRLDPLDIQNYSCVLECRSLEWLRTNEHRITPLEDALCVSLLIFAYRTTEALQQRPTKHFLHMSAGKRLEQALNCTSRFEWQYCPDLLLWILAIGAISAQGSPESDWFVYQTSRACAELDVPSVDVLLSRLDLCGWVSYKLNDAVRQLWDRVIEIRSENHHILPIRSLT